MTSITGPGHVFFGGDFNAHVSYTSTSASVSQGRLCGQDLSGCKLLNLANMANALMCTGSLNGDLHNPSTFRATARSSATRPDHRLISPSLQPCLKSLIVSSHLRGSDHFGMESSLCLPIINVGIPSTLHQGVPLKQIVITSYSIHYTKLYEVFLRGS